MSVAAPGDRVQVSGPGGLRHVAAQDVRVLITSIGPEDHRDVFSVSWGYAQ
jgi:hypothetical protein